MKSGVITTLVCFAVAAHAELDPPGSWNSALPLQAAVSDVIGIGHALSQDSTNAVFQIDVLWYGSPTNSIDITCRTEFPTNGTPFVLFASKYQSFLDLEPSECRYSYIFDTDYHRSRHEPDGMYLLSGDRSWFPTTPENAVMTAWCSNLVYVSQVTTNRQAFYELIRDGYRLHPESS